MRVLKKSFSVIVYLIVIILVLSSLGTIITNQPMLLTAISSNSMVPVFQRGDMVVVWPLANEDTVEPGDIVIFSSESGYLSTQGWIIHRVMEGNVEDGYITMGDNNEYSDQTLGDAPSIERDWMVSRAPTLLGKPVVFPFIGFIPVYFEQLQESPFLLPGIVVILAVLIGLSIFQGTKHKRQKKKKSYFTEQLLYTVSGLTLVLALVATMLVSGEIIHFQYEVNALGEPSPDSGFQSALLLGETEEVELSSLSNQGFFPFTATITSKDPQLRFSRKLLRLSPEDEVEITLQVDGQNPGIYDSTVWVGLYLPLLPPSWIYALAKIHYLLAVFVIALIPGMPLLLFPVLDPKLRRKSRKGFRKNFRKVTRALRF